MITLTTAALAGTPILATIRAALGAAFLLGILPATLAVSGFAAPPAFSSASAGHPLSGSIFGQVRNAQGITQMGAAVQLYNRYEDLIGRGLTNDQGVFIFDGLVPDIYSVRVLLASFVSAERRRITVLPSVQNRLDIRLASVLGSTQLGSGPPAAALMTDDWKWVLRSSPATRPVLRLAPVAASSHTHTAGTQISSSVHGSPFSNTTGFVKLSAGDAGSFLQGSGQDLGTAFALSTSLSGTALVQISGNVGYNANSALPVAGIRTSYTRRMANGSAPLFMVTARQVYLAPIAGAGSGAASGDGGPALRTVAAAFLNNLQLSPILSLDYGVNLQSVSYIQRTSLVSPFLRVTYDAGSWGKIRAAASSGTRPTELLARDAQVGASSPDRGTDQSVGLGVLPMVSRSDHQLTMERARNAELGWELVDGSRTYSLGAFDELVSNAAFMLAGATGFLSQADLLPDLSSHSSIFDVGSYERRGYVVAVKQTVGSRAEVSVSAGRSGALLTDAAVSAHDSDALRAGIHQGQRNWVTMRVAGVMPGTGTRLSANYGWTDFRALMPLHLFVTQSASQDIGVNFYVRQPLPIGGLQGRFSWRLEATAEIRNLLAQGYLPIAGGAGANPQTILTNSPRAVRGGLNIVF